MEQIIVLIVNQSKIVEFHELSIRCQKLDYFSGSVPIFGNQLFSKNEFHTFRFFRKVIISRFRKFVNVSALLVYFRKLQLCTFRIAFAEMKNDLQLGQKVRRWWIRKCLQFAKEAQFPDEWSTKLVGRNRATRIFFSAEKKIE